MHPDRDHRDPDREGMQINERQRGCLAMLPISPLPETTLADFASRSTLPPQSHTRPTAPTRPSLSPQSMTPQPPSAATSQVQATTPRPTRPVRTPQRHQPTLHQRSTPVLPARRRLPLAPSSWLLSLSPCRGQKKKFPDTFDELLFCAGMKINLSHEHLIV